VLSRVLGGALPVEILIGEVPVDPDAGDARRRIIEELSKPEYEAARPTWFDRLSAAIGDWFASLRIGGDGPLQWIVIVAIAVVVLALLVTAFLVFGLPRLNRRARSSGALFGVDDARSAEQMRRAAADAASRSDWAAAIEETYRALARGLAERTILTTTPGTTALGFASRASAAFPGFAAELHSAASAFDAVRYLGGAGSEEAYLEVAALESALRTERPVLDGGLVPA
jgi:hypothetical protein